MNKNNRSIIVSAPGKLMLFGEHAVVYGYPCIVSAVDTRMRVTAELSNTPNDLVITPQVKESKFVAETIKLFKRNFQIEKTVKIRTQGDFSHQVGLGSSSAVTVAAFQALSLLFDKQLTLKQIFSLSYKVTLNIQGIGSGFDIAAASFGKTIYFVYAGRKIEPVKTGQLPLVIGYSGVKADTPTLVRKVAGSYKENKKKVTTIFQEMEKITDKAKELILKKDYPRLGNLMNQNQKLLMELGVSTPKLNQMIEAALKAGAFGAKLSGAGGGDCMISLVSPQKRKQVEEAIRKAGGEIINVATNAKGVQIDGVENKKKRKYQSLLRMQKHTTDDLDEQFIIVDPKDKIINYRSRKDCHTKRLIHRSFSVVILNDKGEVLLQKRSQTKDMWPGYYTLSCSGHVIKGESYQKAARRELKEELGIEIPFKFFTKRLLDYGPEIEMKTVFQAVSNGPFSFCREEIESVKFFSREKLKKGIKRGIKLTPASQKILVDNKFI